MVCNRIIFGKNWYKRCKTAMQEIASYTLANGKLLVEYKCNSCDNIEQREV